MSNTMIPAIVRASFPRSNECGGRSFTVLSVPSDADGIEAGCTISRLGLMLSLALRSEEPGTLLEAGNGRQFRVVEQHGAQVLEEVKS